MGSSNSTADAADRLPKGGSDVYDPCSMSYTEQTGKEFAVRSETRSLEERRSRLPDRWLPVLYFSFAHASLAAAFALTLWDPRGVAGFYYHPKLIAGVHLVTLGWISGSILGAIYMISPMAL